MRDCKMAMRRPSAIYLVVGLMQVITINTPIGTRPTSSLCYMLI